MAREPSEPWGAVSSTVPPPRPGSAPPNVFAKVPLSCSRSWTPGLTGVNDSPSNVAKWNSFLTPPTHIWHPTELQPPRGTSSPAKKFHQLQTEEKCDCFCYPCFSFHPSLSPTPPRPKAASNSFPDVLGVKLVDRCLSPTHDWDYWHTLLTLSLLAPSRRLASAY